jgi:hypothetical protein
MHSTYVITTNTRITLLQSYTVYNLILNTYHVVCIHISNSVNTVCKYYTLHVMCMIRYKIVVTVLSVNVY